MGAERLQALADVGYFNGETLKACEDGGIEAFVPEPNHGRRMAQAGRFGLDDFTDDAAADAYSCPAGKALPAMQGGRKDVTGKLRIKYASRATECADCPLRAQCLAPKGKRRVIERWEHAAVIDRHRARMAKNADKMRRRKALAEHPFGTLKCRAGYRHFLVRGLAKVRGELGLMVLCDNLTRVLSIIGLEKLVAWLASPSFWPALAPLMGFVAAVSGARGRFCRFCNALPRIGGGLLRNAGPSGDHARSAA